MAKKLDQSMKLFSVYVYVSAYLQRSILKTSYAFSGRERRALSLHEGLLLHLHS